MGDSLAIVLCLLQGTKLVLEICAAVTDRRSAAAHRPWHREADRSVRLDSDSRRP